jgi:hypothetical protein
VGLVGDGGSGLGYDGLGGKDDWAVEIDTYQTSVVRFIRHHESRTY